MLSTPGGGAEGPLINNFFGGARVRNLPVTFVPWAQTPQ
jgi:hypothetical protein